jgi:AcrR family transcriptional regulator
MARIREAGMEERILDSAFKVFGEQGFAATTIKDIAAGADISSGSIYTYFPDKEALFRAAVRRGWTCFIDELEKIDRRGLAKAERSALLMDKGFSALSDALPLIRGMFFDASRLNLIEDNLDRVCLAIDALLAPGEGEAGQASWESTRPGRLLITRMIILGVLASVALVPQPAPEDIVDKLREATSSLLAQAQAGVGARP